MEDDILELLNKIWSNPMQGLIDGHMGVDKPMLYRTCSTMAGGSYFRALKDALVPLGMKVSEDTQLMLQVGSVSVRPICILHLHVSMQAIMVSGHWCGSRSNLHIDAANADAQLLLPKTQHDWIAIHKDAETYNIEQWYSNETTIAFDPTHYQFSRDTTERFVWSAKDCIEVKHHLAPDYKNTCIKNGCMDALLEERITAM